GDEVGGGVDRRDGRAGLLERGHHLVAGPLGDPPPDVGVQQVGVLGAGGAGGEPGLVDDLGVADQPHDPLGDGVGAGGHGDPVAVGGAVEVARRVVGGAV